MNRPGAPQTQLLVATIGAERSTPDYAALNVLNAALGGLFSSRINMNLREKHGYTYGAFSQFLFRKSPGPVLGADRRSHGRDRAGGGRDPEGDSRHAARRRCRPKNWPPRATRSSAGCRADFETSGRTSNMLSTLFVYDLGLDYYTRYPASVSAVSGADAQAAARKYLDPAKLIVVAVGDRAKIEAGLKKLNLGRVLVQ